MATTRFSEEQIAGVLTLVEAGRVAEVCRSHGISQGTSDHWKEQACGRPESRLQQLRQREDENGRRKQIVVDLTLVHMVLRDVRRKTSLRSTA